MQHKRIIKNLKPSLPAPHNVRPRNEYDLILQPAAHTRHRQQRYQLPRWWHKQPELHLTNLLRWGYVPAAATWLPGSSFGPDTQMHTKHTTFNDTQRHNNETYPPHCQVAPLKYTTSYQGFYDFSAHSFTHSNSHTTGYWPSTAGVIGAASLRSTTVGIWWSNLKSTSIRYGLSISNLPDSDTDADVSHNYTQSTHLTAKYMHWITIYLRPHILNTELDEKFSSNSEFSLHGH